MAKRVQRAVTAVRIGKPPVRGMNAVMVENDGYQSTFNTLKEECKKELYEAAQTEAGVAEYDVVNLTMDYKIEFGDGRILIVSGTLVYSYEREE